MEKHKHLLDMLIWEEDNTWVGDLVQAVRCPLNPGIPDSYRPLEAHIYVDDILASAVDKQNILRLLTTIIKAIFVVCGCSMIEVRQCLLSLENGRNKWSARFKLAWD